MFSVCLSDPTETDMLSVCQTQWILTLSASLPVRPDEDCHVCCLSDLMKINVLSVRPDELKCYLSDPMKT